MAQCAKCGATGEGMFCGTCGSPMPEVPAPPPWSAGQPPAAPPPPYPPAAPPPQQPYQSQPNYPPPPPNPGYQQQQYQQPPNPGYQQPPPNYQAAPAAAGMEDNVAGALCYVLGILTGVLFLFLEPYSRNREVRFHAFQSIFFGASWFVAAIVMSIVGTMVAFLPYIGWIISLVLWTLIPLAFIVIYFLLIYKAYNKEHWLLPVIGPLAEKQAYSS